MKHRALDLFLLIVVAIGGALAWQTGRERSRLSGEHARLARITGDLPIADASQVHVQALDTGEPLHFAWRVYFPPNYRQTLRNSNGGEGTSWSSSSTEFIARVVFRQDEQGLLQVYTHFSGGSSRSGLGDKALAELLRGRWDKIRVEQLGAPDLAALGPNQPAVLLRLTLPDDLQAEARKKLPPHTQKRFVPVLFELDLGPKASKP
jgi:hypothetical protein